MKGAFKQIGTLILDLAYPRVCPICKKLISDSDNIVVCNDCKATLEYIGELYCQKCSQPIADSFEDNKHCSACSGMKLHFERAVAVGRYYGGLRELILALKSGGRYLSRFLGGLLAEKLRRQYFISEIDLVAPVPLWRWDIFRRYNQAGLLADEIVRQLKLPYSNILIKIKRTPPQVSLDGIARRMNLENAFAVKNAKKIQSKNILLIDDVMTTGATVSECAKTLKNAGAKSVYVGIVGRTILEFELI